MDVSLVLRVEAKCIEKTFRYRRWLNPGVNVSAIHEEHCSVTLRNGEILSSGRPSADHLVLCAGINEVFCLAGATCAFLAGNRAVRIREHNSTSIVRIRNCLNRDRGQYITLVPYV